MQPSGYLTVPEFRNMATFLELDNLVTGGSAGQNTAELRPTQPSREHRSTHTSAEELAVWVLRSARQASSQPTTDPRRLALLGRARELGGSKAGALVLIGKESVATG